MVLLYILIIAFNTKYVIDMDKFKEELNDFIDKSTSCYTCIEEIKKKLDSYGYIELYKEDLRIWNKYLKKETTDNRSFNINNILDYAKNIDATKLQDGITSIQKAIDLFGGMLTKDSPKEENNTYRPRPVYRRFDD